MGTSNLQWLDAVRHCQDKEANLVEIFTEYQLDFVRMELDMLDDHEDPKWWWTGGNDIGREGNWKWLVSSAPVGDFIWISGFPQGGNSRNCLDLVPNSYEYMAADSFCTNENLYPICQKFI